MSMSVASVTLAYNAKALVARQIEALLRQAESLREIIVVDNASSDGTAEFVAAAYPKVTIIRLPTNEGVGGGYSAGLQYAVFEKNHDWVWTLDQDSVPGPDALSKLLAVWEETKRGKVGLIAPLSVDSVTGTPGSAYLWRDKPVQISPADFESPLCYVDMVISSGSMIRNVAVRTAGLPRKDFFIDWVDCEYCLRLRRLGFQIVVATQCLLPHTIGSPRTVRWLGKERLRLNHAPWREYYKVRNRAFVLWREMPSWRTRLFVLGQFLKQATGTLLFDPEKLQRLKLMSMGLWHGIRGRLENKVKPRS